MIFATTVTDLYGKWSNRILILDKADFCESIPVDGFWQFIGQIESIDVLNKQKTDSVKDDQRRASKTELTLFQNKCQPAVVDNTPCLKSTTQC